MRRAGTSLAALLLVGLAPVAVAGQATSAAELAARVGALDGDGIFRIAIRDGVEVCEDGVRSDDGHVTWNWDEGRRGVCSTGVAAVELTVRGGTVTRLELEPWTGEAPRGAADLGRVESTTALDFFVGLASGEGVPSRLEPGERGLMATSLLEGVESWPPLLELARDRSLDRDVRRAALFWVGQAAADRMEADAVARGLAEVARDDDEDGEVRKAAVFALSQRPADEAVPTLIEVVRTVADTRVKRSALFWLAQHDTPAVTGFFEEILAGG